MKISEIINRILANFGIALVRRSTFESMSTNSSSSVSLSNNDIKVDDLRKELLRYQTSSKWEVIDYLELLVGVVDKNENCTLCGYTGLSKEFTIFESQCIFGGGRLTRLQCPHCDVIFGPKKMLSKNAAELTQDYESHYKMYEEGDSTEQEIRAFHLLKPSLQGVYLNYGAGGWSKSVETLRDQGWNVFAFEPHDSACSNLDYLIKSKSDLLKLRFDGIFSNNVLEHLRYPVDELSFMKTLLKPTGEMSHATPCFEYLYEYTRFHLFFYLGHSRTLLAEKADLAISDFVKDGDFMCALYQRKIE